MKLLASGSAVILIALFATLRPSVYRAQVTREVLLDRVAPFGVNLGTWTSWGAEQLSSNVIKNPGFEGLIDRAIVVNSSFSAGTFEDDHDWLARPDAFWEGARYSIRSGASAGREGLVVHSRARGMRGLPSFTASDSALSLDAGNVVSLTRVTDTELPTQWWFSQDSGARFVPELHDKRPGSPGSRALRVSATAGANAEVASYLDAIGDRAGKLLPFEGKWNLSFWTRLGRGAASLHVTLGRDRSAPFVTRDISLTSNWQQVHLSFAAQDNSSSGIAGLRFRTASQTYGEVLLDDVDLRRASEASFPFRTEVVSALEQIRPGYLRNWEGQLGETLENYVAEPLARRATRYRPGESSQADFGYSLPDFLALSLAVHASPWIVLPPTFTDAECAGLGSYLAADPRFRAFHEIVTEFGNENWNPLFRPGGIPDPVAHGEAADRCLSALRDHAAGLPIRTAINSQHANPSAAAGFASSSGSADMLVLAPYLMHSLNSGVSRERAEAALFAGDSGNMAAIALSAAPLHKEIGVYEVNLHTNEGSATSAERDPITAGPTSGSALAKVMLENLALGARRQCVYTLAGFDSHLARGDGFVRLWGIVRDLGPTRRFRPTGLALKLLNRAVQGDLHKVNWSGPSDINVYAFQGHQSWSAALVSANDAPQSVHVRFPLNGSAALPDRMLTIVADSPDATNEDAEHVRIQETAINAAHGEITVALPAHSFAVLVASEVE